MLRKPNALVSNVQVGMTAIDVHGVIIPKPFVRKSLDVKPLQQCIVKILIRLRRQGVQHFFFAIVFMPLFQLKHAHHQIPRRVVGGVAH